MSPGDAMLWPLLYKFFVVLALVFATVGLALGIGLIAASSRTLGLFAVLNRWISTRGAYKALDIPRTSELLARANRRWLGIALIAGGVFAAVGLVTRMDPAAVGVAFAQGGMAKVVAIVAATAKWVLVCGSVAGVAVGVLLFFPETLARVEAIANRWVSTRQVARQADEAHLGLDRVVAAHPRPAGWIFVCTSLGALIYALVLLAARA